MPAITGSATIHKDEWRTDPALFKKVKKAFSFGVDLDAAATLDNALCPHYFTKQQNALERNWYNPDIGVRTVWLNPPFSMAHEFLEKATEEWKKGATIVCLLRADAPETCWWRSHMLTSQGYLKHRVFYLYPRLNYFNTENERVSGVTLPSCLVLMSHGDDSTHRPRWIQWRKYVDFKHLFE